MITTENALLINKWIKDEKKKIQWFFFVVFLNTNVCLTRDQRAFSLPWQQLSDAGEKESLPNRKPLSQKHETRSV